MPPRRPPRPTPPDVDLLRTALGQGKLVRVGIAPSGQFPDGVTGRVRRIGDPAVDGDEFIFVEVPIGGAKDVLPFAPNDLIGTPARKPAAPAAPSSSVGSVRSVRSEPVTSRPAPTRPPAARPGVGQPVTTPATAPAPTPATAPAATQSTPAPAEPAGVPSAGRPAPKASSAGRGKRAPVSITISTAGDESASWRIEAKIGAKVAVRPTSIPPSRVWEIVQSLAEPKLTALVQTLLDDHRRSTQARADALAAELSVLQAELKSFPE